MFISYLNSCNAYGKNTGRPVYEWFGILRVIWVKAYSLVVKVIYNYTGGVMPIGLVVLSLDDLLLVG